MIEWFSDIVIHDDRAILGLSSRDVLWRYRMVGNADTAEYARRFGFIVIS